MGYNTPFGGGKSCIIKKKKNNLGNRNVSFCLFQWGPLVERPNATFSEGSWSSSPSPQSPCGQYYSPVMPVPMPRRSTSWKILYGLHRPWGIQRMPWASKFRILFYKPIKGEFDSCKTASLGIGAATSENKKVRRAAAWATELGKVFLSVISEKPNSFGEWEEMCGCITS